MNINKVLVDIEGEGVKNIQDLPREQYEEFIEEMHRLYLVYAVMVGRKNI
jgi:hypothetical protein